MRARAHVTVPFVLICLAACDSLPARPEGPGQTAHRFSTEIRRRIGCDYLLHLPADYGRDDRRWPLLLFLHGAGERGSDLALVQRFGPPTVAATDPGFPFILVSPQCPPDDWWDPEILTALLDDIVSRYHVDEDRICVTGLSMGGFGTLALAAAIPDRIAAIAPVCGGGDPRWARRLGHVPTWVFHGARDPIVSIGTARRMVEALQDAGGDVRITVYSDLGHVCWEEAYGDPALYEWLLEQRRHRGLAAPRAEADRARESEGSR